MWITFLYVQIEAWQSRAMLGARSYMMARAPIATHDIDRVIAEGKRNSNLAKMRNVRDYMCHRDKRAYWDAGRVDVTGQLAYHEAVCQVFSTAFLAVVKNETPG